MPPALPGAVIHFWLPGCLHAASSGEMTAVPQQWGRQALRLVGYPPGVRRAVVLLSGSEPRFWAGHYGAKLASPRLTLCC